MDVDRKLREVLRLDSQKLQYLITLLSLKEKTADKGKPRAFGYKKTGNISKFFAIGSEECGNEESVPSKEENNTCEAYCHVDTLIGGQSIFAEEGKALEHDDNDAAMKTLQDEAILESESEEMSKYKSRVDLSQIQQQRGQRGFHKVRFKVRLRRSCKVTDEKVTKDGELFKLEKSELLHKGRKYTRKLIVRWYYYKVRKRVKPLGAAETGFKCLSKAGTEAGYKAKIIVSAVGVMLHETVEDKDLRFRSGTIRTDGREQRAVGKEHLTSKGSGEFEIGLYPWGHDDMEEDTWEFEIEITDQKRSIHMFKKSMETWAKESNFGQAECLRVVDSYCEGAGSQNPNVDGNRVWNPGVLVVEEDKSYSRIYVGAGKVIHCTRRGGLEIGTGTYLDKIIQISVPRHGGDNPCPNCGDQSTLNGVISSCLDCFLAGGNLYLFQYDVSKAILVARRSSQVNSVCAAGGVASLALRFIGVGRTAGQAASLVVCPASVVSAAASAISTTLGFVTTGFSAMAVAGYSKYCIGRVAYDVGVRKYIRKVPVEELSTLMAVLEGNILDNDNNDKNVCET
ncbi:hypothetical protein DY000_02030036 [Brassica cretica]|uniref:LRAT domain-containing protein n=1 Tax=Brassica cretica TaxID=69181 RepID=A0ABQ7DHU3_BRACR|nr:hypothetical protein DY000_02030036 [Brassica cretica]